MTGIAIIDERELFGRVFRIYGTFENPLFLAKAVAEMIDYSKTSEGYYNASKMLMCVDEDEKCTITNVNSGGKSTFLTEDGLYEVLMQSRKPIAKEFKKKVKTILQQIRMTGGYIPVNESDTDLEIVCRALKIMQKTIDEKDVLIEEQAKKLTRREKQVQYANMVSRPGNYMSVGDAAKYLIQMDISMGELRLFKWLRENNYLMKQGKRHKPQQWAIEAGYLHQSKIDVDSYGSTDITLITPEGLLHLMSLFSGGDHND